MSFIPDVITRINSPYQYRACWQFLETKGQIAFGPHFSLYARDGEIILKLMAWALKDEAQAAKHQIDLRKGIMLCGPVGCGKSALMKLLCYVLPPPERYMVKPCREIAFEFGEEGFPVLTRYTKQYTSSLYSSNGEPRAKPICFDDLGREPAVQYFGNTVNVMAELLHSRYDYYFSHSMCTHITTNLNSAEIEEHYGKTVRSRSRELFNLVSFDKSAPDKRGQAISPGS